MKDTKCLKRQQSVLLFSYSSAFPTISLGFTIFGVFFPHVTNFVFSDSNHRDSNIPSSRMMYAGCVFVAGIHPSRTCLSGSFESMPCNACAYRQDLSLYSHPKEF